MQVSGIYNIFSKNSHISVLSSVTLSAANTYYYALYANDSNIDLYNTIDATNLSAYIIARNSSKIFINDYKLSDYQLYTDQNSFINFPCNISSSRINAKSEITLKNDDDNTINLSNIPLYSTLLNDGNTFYWKEIDNINNAIINDKIKEIHINFSKKNLSFNDSYAILSAIPKDLHRSTLVCHFNTTSGDIHFNNFYNGKILCSGKYYATSAQNSTPPSAATLVFNNCENVELRNLSAYSAFKMLTGDRKLFTIYR